MLQQLFPDRFFGEEDDDWGLASLGSGLLDAAGVSATGAPQRLQVIPDTRSNALFVNGPAEMVRDIEEMLKVLDAAELPESLRDRVPRMIPVQYADVNEVAQIVRNVYADQMGDSGGRSGSSSSSRGSGQDLAALAMMMGRSSSRSRTRRRASHSTRRRAHPSQPLTPFRHGFQTPAEAHVLTVTVCGYALLKVFGTLAVIQQVLAEGR
jgi:hypothetical protein